MTAIVFPTNPTVGDIFTHGPRSWVWNSVSWESTKLYSNEVDGGTSEGSSESGYVFIDGGNA